MLPPSLCHISQRDAVASVARRRASGPPLQPPSLRAQAVVALDIAGTLDDLSYPYVVILDVVAPSVVAAHVVVDFNATPPATTPPSQEALSNPIFPSPALSCSPRWFPSLVTCLTAP